MLENIIPSSQKQNSEKNVPTQGDRIETPKVTSDIVPQNNIVESTLLPINKSFDFKPVADFFPVPDKSDFVPGVGDDYMQYLSAVGGVTNRYVPITLPRDQEANMPANATGRYNPVSQALPDQEGRPNALQSIIDKNIVKGYEERQERGNIADISPIYYSRSASRFDRYYKHPKFDQLGFHPYVDNESYYNSNSSVWDDASRMLTQAGNQFGSAFASTYRSIGDLFDGDNYWTGKDTKTAEDFMSATDIGMSSRGGVSGFMNNLVLNSSYTFGIIANIAVEELALGALTSVTGGATAPALGTSLAAIPGKLKNLFSVTRFGSASKNLVKNLDNVEKAKDFWTRTQAGRDFVGDIFLPNTTAAVRRLRTTENTAGNAMNMAKSRPMAIEFYSDFRDLNFAMAEAKLEGGIVYNEQLQSNINKIMERDGVGTLTPEMMAEATENANKAAFYTTVANAPFIFFSNKIVLGPALRGFRGNRFFREAFNEGSGLFGKRIVQQQSAKQISKKGAQEAGDVFVDVGEGFGSGFRRLKTLGFAGSSRKFAQGGLRYFAANVTEGVQELYQEAIAAGTQDYYTTLIKDPSATHKFAYKNAFQSAIGSQFSGQGLETFLSGFLMGGLVQGPQRVLFSSIPNFYNRVTKPEEYAQIQRDKETYVAAAVQSANQMSKSIGTTAVSPFDTSDFNMFAMNQGAQGINGAELNGDKFDFYNQQDYTRFVKMHQSIMNGTSGAMKDYVPELENLTDEDLTNLYSEENTSENAAGIRKKLQTVTNDIGKVERTMEEAANKIAQPYDPSKYKEGSKEYFQEVRNAQAIQHIRYLYAFTNETFRKSVERFDSIFQSLQSDPILADIQASDLTMLLDPKSVNREIQLLITEIASMQQDEAFAEEVEIKKQKIEKLKAFLDVLKDPINLKSDETFNRRRDYIKKLRAPFLSYVQFLADSRDTFIDVNEIDNTLQKIVDYGYLKGTAKQYAKAVEFMLNPEVIEDLRERTAGTYEFLNENREAIIKAMIDQQVTDAAVNGLFNKLFELGVVTDITETEEFLKDYDISKLNIFYGETEVVNAIDDVELYTKITAALNEFNELHGALKTADEVAVEEVDTQLTTVDEFLENNNLKKYNLVEYGKRQGNELIYLKSVLEHQYLKYKNEEQTLGNDVITYNEWLNSSKYGRKIIQAHDLLKQIYANQLASQTPEQLGITFTTANEFQRFLNTDRGFAKWLSSKETEVNPLVKEALNISGLVYGEMFTTKPQRLDATNVVIQNAVGSLVKQQVEGSVVFTILDSNGKSLSAEVLERAGLNPTGYFLSEQEAKDAFKSYTDTFKTSEAWVFSDVEIRNGDTLLRKADGAKFQVYSSAKDNGVRNKIYIIPIDIAASDQITKEQNKIPVTRGQMRGYRLETFDNTVIETAKVVSFDAVGVYAKSRENLTREQAEERLQQTFAALTPQELAKLSISVSRNSQETAYETDYTIEKDGEVQSNPQVKRKQEEYMIEVKIMDKKTQDRINKVLEDLAIAPFVFSEDTGIGFIPNSQFLFFDSAGNPVDARNMTSETAREIFTEKSSDVDLVQKNFAIQNALMSAIAKQGVGTYRLSKLKKGFRFDVVSRRAYSEDKSRRTADSLKYNTVDGTTVIYRRTGETVTPYTNIEDLGTQAKFLKDLENGLKEQGLWDQIKTTNKDRAELHLIVKLPSGKLQYLPFDLLSMTKERFDGLMEEVMQKSIDIRSRYTEQQLKDKAALEEVQEFNQSIRNRLFISSETEGKKRIDLEINPFTGLVQLNAKKGKDKPVRISAEAQDDSLLPDEFGKSLIAEANKKTAFTDITGTLTEKNFKEDLPRPGVQITTEDILDRATTAIAPEVVTVAGVNLTASSEAIEEAMNVAATTNNLPLTEQPEIEQEEVTAETVEQDVEDSTNATSRTEEVSAEQLREQYEEIQSRIQARRVELVSALKTADEIKADPILLELTKQHADILKKINPGAANKILDGSITFNDVTDIDEFVEWAKEVLPDFITVGDIDQLGSNLKKGGVRVGAFVLNLQGIGQGIEGNIYTGASNPFKYHEAFHAVFRMLLSDQEITQFLKIGKKELAAKLKSEGKTFSGELNRLRNSAKMYESMSDQRLEQELIEEYIADRFEEFKQDRKATKTDSILKSFFNRLIELIKSVFKVYTPNELTTLFEKIDAGKFKDSSTQLNRFTKVAFNGVTLEADKLLPVEIIGDAKTGVTRYVDSTVAKQLTASMAANFIMRYEEQPAPIDVEFILDEVVKDFANLYSTANPANATLDYQQKLTLLDLSLAFSDNQDSIKSAVKEYLNLYELQISEQQDNAEDKFDSEGDRTVDQWDKSQELIGGIRSLPLFIRRYIATTTLSSKDIFGRDILVNDSPFATTVEVGKAYSGLVKSARNTTDNLQMIRNMVQFAQSNPQTKAVMDRFLNDVGIDPVELMDEGFGLENVTNPVLFQKFVTAFQNFVVDNRIIQRDQKSGRVRIFSAGNRDDAQNQINVWGQAFNERTKMMENDPEFKADATRSLNSLLSYFQSAQTISDEALSEFAMDASDKLATYAGIFLNAEYIKYSILKNIAQPTASQQRILDSNVGTLELNLSDLEELATEISKGQYIFDSGSQGMQGRILKLANGNALFDETVFLSTFRNANGDLVYAHQSPTFHLQRVNELNNEAEQDLLLAKPELSKNTLLNSTDFRQMGLQGMLKVIRLNGITNAPFDRTGSTSVIEESTYGELSAEDFLASIVNMYLNGVENNTDSVQSINDKALAPVLIRVIEASNTGDFISLPVIKAVESNGNISSEVMQHFQNAIETEFARIKDVIINQDTAPAITDYNTGANRGFTFFNTGKYMDPATKSSLETLLKGKTPEELNDLDLATALKEAGSSLSKVRRDIISSLDSQFADFKAAVPSSVSSTITTATTNDQTNSRLNLIQNNLDHNLKQIFLNDLVNTESINDILLGDQSLTVKDAVDQVKRAKMQNAAGKSAKHDIIAPELGINEPLSKFELVPFTEPTGTSIHSGDNIDVADAQMYMTIKAFKHMFFGFGKLTKQQARLLDQVELGADISAKELYGNVETGEQGYAQLQAMLNSKKVVYGDGKSFIKTSGFVLTPALTSTKESGYTQAKPNRVALHNLRLNLEAVENSEDTEGTIAVAAPVSALKMYKENVNEFENIISGQAEVNSTTLDADFLRLQVINPSNKQEVTDMTQLKTLITAEQTTKHNKDRNKKNIVIDDVSYSAVELTGMYHSLTAARLTNTFRQRRNLLLDFSMETAMEELDRAKKTGDVSINLWSFAEYASSSLKASNSSSTLLEVFVNEDGQMKYDPNNPISIDKFEQLFFAFFSQSLREKVPGDKVTMVSDFGHYVYRRVFTVDENGNPDRSEVIRESVAEKEGLQPINVDTPENISMLADAVAEAGGSGVVILDRLRPNVKEYDKNGKFTGVRYSESLMPTTDSNVYTQIDLKGEAIPEVVSKMVGTRIPSQDKHSAAAIKVVDFLPAYYGSVGVFPREMVEVAGSDFDVDAVYLHKKEFYTDGKNFLEYGKESTDKGRFFAYQTYLNSQVKKPGSTLNRALVKFNSNVAQIPESKAARDLRNMIGVLTKDAYNAASMLGLPTTLEEFEAYRGTPSIAEINNNLVDVKFALLGNEYMTNTPGREVAIAFEPASTNELKAYAEVLASTYPSVAEASREDNVNVNSIVGKTSSFKNNKEGAGNIGAAVIPNQILSLFREYSETLNKAIKIDGVSYNDLSSQFQRDAETGQENVNGIRNQYLISEMVTAMTDNAKDRLAAKLNLTREGLGMLTATTALGIDFKIVLALLNTPQARQVFEQVKQGDNFNLAVSSVSNTKSNSLKKYSGKLKRSSIDAALRLEATKNDELAVFQALKDIRALANEILTHSKIISLSKGMGKNVESLMDLEDALGRIKEHKYLSEPKYLESSYYAAYLQAAEEVNEMAEQVLLTAHPVIKNALAGFTSTVRGATEEQRVKFKRDVVSYYTLRQYREDVANSSSTSIASLTNSFLYGVDVNQNAVETVEKLRQIRMADKDLANKPNYFLDRFIIPQRVTDANNKTGLSLVAANTFNQLSDSQKVDLQNSVLVLYNNPFARPLITDLIHYVMVKDGLQYNYGGLLDAIPVALLDRFNQSVINTRNEISFEKGSMIPYFTSASVVGNLKNITVFNTEDISVSDNSASITFSEFVEEMPVAFKIEDEFDASTSYFILDVFSDLNPISEQTARYVQFTPQGSNKQNGMGYLFDTQAYNRPSVGDILRLVRTSNSQPSTLQQDLTAEQKEMLDALADPNNIIEATNESIEITERPVSEPIEDAAEAIEEAIAADDPLGQLSGQQLELFGNPTEEMKRAWSALSVAENKAKLEKAGLKSFADFSKLVEQYESLEEAVDHIKECYL